MKEYNSNNYKAVNDSIDQEIIRLKRLNQRSFALSLIYFVISFSILVIVIALIFYLYDYHSTRPETVVMESHSEINETMNSGEQVIDISQDWTIFDYKLVAHDKRVVTGTVYNKQSYPAPLRQYCYVEVDSEDIIYLIKIKSGVLIEVTSDPDLLFALKNYCSIDDIDQFI